MPLNEETKPNLEPLQNELVWELFRAVLAQD